MTYYNYGRKHTMLSERRQVQTDPLPKAGEPENMAKGMKNPPIHCRRSIWNVQFFPDLLKMNAPT